MQSLRDERGQALIVVALAFTCVLGFVGLAVDVGGLLHDKRERELQVAADAAAIAGALHLNYPEGTGQLKTRARQMDSPTEAMA
jgi:uncharacterized membrane protein